MENDFIRCQQGQFVRRSAIVRIRVKQADVIIPRGSQTMKVTSTKWHVIVTVAGCSDEIIAHVAEDQASAMSWAEEHLLR